MAFGKPKFGGEGRKSIKGLKDGSTRARVLPPILSGVKTGKWCQQHKQHFGFDTPRGEDSKDRNWNTFYCVEVFDFKTKTTTQECPECAAIKAQKELKDSTEKALKAKGKTDADIAKTVEPIVEWLRKHNLDNKYYINVKTPEGEYFTLKIPFKAKEKLFNLIEEYRNPKVPGRKAIDAIDAEQGLWFDFIRTGKGFNTSYDVKVVTEPIEVNGEVFEKTKLAPLTDADAEAAEAACYDLADVGIRRLPLEKVQMLVNATEVEEIDAIFGSSERSPERSRERSAPATGEIHAAANARQNPSRDVRESVTVREEPKANTPSDLGARPAPAAPAAEQDEEAAIVARLAAIQKAKAEKAAAEKLAAQTAARQEAQATTTTSAKALVAAAEKVQDRKEPASTPLPENVMDMDEDEFMKRFGPKK